jgi:hypothetical protein
MGHSWAIQIGPSVTRGGARGVAGGRRGKGPTVARGGVPRGGDASFKRVLWVRVVKGCAAALGCAAQRGGPNAEAHGCHAEACARGALERGRDGAHDVA